MIIADDETGELPKEIIIDGKVYRTVETGSSSTVMKSSKPNLSFLLLYIVNDLELKKL